MIKFLKRFGMKRFDRYLIAVAFLFLSAPLIPEAGLLVQRTGLPVETAPAQTPNLK